ncbi:MAG: NAD(P)H-hydrate dehydratase [Eubacteriales bacterium]|nr:NAD(P)H-hydrate dehydratase [Eubacteriales bacterium]
MLRTITPQDMKRVERLVMEKTGVTGEALMERAAAGVVQAVNRCSVHHGGKTLCLCGTGNNGGDGLAAMRLLAAEGNGFEGLCWILPGSLSPDCEKQLKRLEREQPQVQIFHVQSGSLPPLPGKAACVIDALFGTGLTRALTGDALAACELINRLGKSGVPIVAVDIPSGLDGSAGKILGDAVHASETVTFHRPKLGLYLADGMDCAGKVTVWDIGLPSELDDAPGLWVMEEKDIPRLIPPRKRLSHKGSYGRVLIWAGKRGMAGAAALCATAALRTGAGLVTVACEETIMDTVQLLCPCATCLPLPHDEGEAWSLLHTACIKADAIALGCGLGQEPKTEGLLLKLLNELAAMQKPLLLDADGLNMLASLERAGKAPRELPNAVLTPHPAEAARLLGCKVETVTSDSVTAAERLSQRYGASVVLKGAASVLVAKSEHGLNVLGTPAMAKGGSGDALTGVLAALFAGNVAGAYELSALELLQAGCGLHGLAGVLAEKRFGERGVLATDLCTCLGLVGQRNALPQEPGLQSNSPLGRKVTVTVDHKIGSRPAQNEELLYKLNYGYVQEVLAADNDWQDAYIWGEKTPLEYFEGVVTAVIHRLHGERAQWVVAKAGLCPTEQEIREATAFQEESFDSWIER